MISSRNMRTYNIYLSNKKMLGFAKEKRDRINSFVRILLEQLLETAICRIFSLFRVPWEIVALWLHPAESDRPIVGADCTLRQTLARNIRHMTQLRTHETTLPVFNSFSVDRIFLRVPFIRSLWPKKDGAITVCKIEVWGIKRIRHVMSRWQSIWGYCKIAENCERKKVGKIENDWKKGQVFLKDIHMLCQLNKQMYNILQSILFINILKIAIKCLQFYCTKYYCNIKI